MKRCPDVCLTCRKIQVIDQIKEIDIDPDLQSAAIALVMLYRAT
jgi:hypothetical protein